MPISYTLTTPVGDYPYTFPPDVSLGQTAPLGELFRQLSYGELSDLEAAVEASGTIRAGKRNQVIHQANEALKRLHKRFELIVDDEVLTVPASSAEFEHVLDPMEIQVISMLVADGSSLTFLTHPVPGKIYLYNRVLSFPPSGWEYQVQVTYQRRHPELLPISEDSDLEQPISLVTELWPAMRAYIAGEMYGSMNTADAQAQALKFRNRYLEVCAEVEATGAPAQQMLDTQKSVMRGFV